VALHRHYPRGETAERGGVAKPLPAVVTAGRDCPIPRLDSRDTTVFIVARRVSAPV